MFYPTRRFASLIGLVAAAALLALGTVATVSGVPSNDGTVVLSLEPASATLAPGDELTLSMLVDARAHAIDGIQVYATFDPVYLSVVDCLGKPTPGPIFSGT